MNEIELNITSDYEEVEKVSDKITEFLTQEGIDELIRNAFNICLTEALNNVIKHSYKGEKGKLINVKVIKEKDFVEIYIIDEGIPRESLEIKNLDYDPEDLYNLPESGMGLFIIQQLMDELDYYSVNGKNYFILKKWLL